MLALSTASSPHLRWVRVPFSRLRCLPGSAAGHPGTSVGVSGSAVGGGRLSGVRRESGSSRAHLQLLSHRGSTASPCLTPVPTSQCLTCCSGGHPCPCSDALHGAKLSSQPRAALARQSTRPQGPALVKVSAPDSRLLILSFLPLRML